MKVTTHFFKPSGKWYETEEVEMPETTEPWDARKYVEQYLNGRLSGMTAVMIDNPWGFPLSIPNLA